METLNKLYLELSTVVSPDTKTERELQAEAQIVELKSCNYKLNEKLGESEDRIGELNLALAAQKEQLAHLERTKTLSLNLVKAMEAVHASEDFKGVWALAQVHGVEYKGPTYKKEFAELKKEVFA